MSRKCFITVCNLEDNQIEIVKDFTNNLNFNYEEEFNTNVTHIIVQNNFEDYNGCYENAKYILGIANKKFIISYQWILDCINNNNELLDEENYEVKDPCLKQYISRNSRLGEYNLFSNFIFFLGMTPDFDALFEDRDSSSLNDLNSIISTNGGTIVSTIQELKSSVNKLRIILVSKFEENAFDDIIETDDQILIVHFNWILHSIRTYSLKPLYFYLKMDVNLSQLDFCDNLLRLNEKHRFDEVRHRIQAIFTNVEHSCIKKVCFKFLRRYCQNHQNFMLDLLIDHFLLEGENNNNQNEEMEETELRVDFNAMSIEQKCVSLKSIFPDAEPSYIKNFIENNNDEEKILEFIDINLQNKTYVTKIQSLNKTKNENLLKIYFNNFNVIQYLEIVYDPFKEFEGENRFCKFSQIGYQFLKSLFPDCEERMISEKYESQNFNLTQTVNNLHNFKIENKEFNINIVNINLLDDIIDVSLLQEMSFIVNKEKIKSYYDVKKQEREMLFSKYKQEEKLIECQSCFSKECLPEEICICDKDHKFCFDCLRKGTDININNGMYSIPCFSCDSLFSFDMLKKALNPKTFEILFKNHQIHELKNAKIEGLESCPFCGFSYILSKEDNIFKCSDCMKESCRKCKKISHIPYQCDELEKIDKSRLLIEEKMTEAIVRKCYNCDKKFIKEASNQCNMIVCSCSAKMCYLCDAKNVDYEHFNAQGGSNYELCPLWTDDNYIDAESVHLVAHAATNKILKENPNLKIEIDKLLPSIPEKSSGSHDSVANSFVTPVRITQMIAKDCENK